MIIIYGFILIAGVVLMIAAQFHRTSAHPGLGGFHPRHWSPIWRQQDWYSARGYWMNLVGTTLVVVGGIAGSVFIW
jgi:hypothetical protein